MTSIGEKVFTDCFLLTNIVIPSSVTTIGKSAFSGCASLKSVYYKGTESGWEKVAIVTTGNTKLNSATRYYYDESESVGNWWHYTEKGAITHA